MARGLSGSCLCDLLSAGCTILIITAFPLVEVIIGALYIHECPVAPVIPVYVMVCGILTLLVIALFALPKLHCQGTPGSTILALSIFSLILFVAIWILYGSYQVYSIHPPNYDKNLTDTNRVNNSIYTPAAPDNRLVLTLENQNQNQNQSLPHLNHTWMMNNNQTLMKMIQTLVQSNMSSKSTGEHLNAPRLTDVVPYCDRTVYLFAFCTTTLAHVFVGISLVIIVCLYVCMKFSVSLVEVVYS